MDYQELFPVPVEWLQDVDRSMARTVADWADAEVMAGRLEHKEDHHALLLPAMRKLLVDIGLQSMLWPEEMGGGGLGTPDAAMTLAAVIEQVGRADSGIAFVLANTFALQSAFAIEPYKNEALLEHMAPVVCGKDPVIASLILPSYSKDPDAAAFYGLPYQAAAKRDADGWLLSARDARPQCSGAGAYAFGVACAGESDEPMLVLVAPHLRGFSTGEPFKKTGLAASINADITMDGVRAADAQVLLQGTTRMRGMLAWYYTLCAAACSGALLATYDIIKEWGDTRVIKGKGQVFKENPLVASLLGEIGGKMAMGRLLTFNAARLLSAPNLYGPAGSPPVATAATAAFKLAARGAMEAMDNTMELMASAGYATEWNLERYWRDVKTLESCVLPETVAQTDLARHYFDLKEL